MGCEAGFTSAHMTRLPPGRADGIQGPPGEPGPTVPGRRLWRGEALALCTGSPEHHSKESGCLFRDTGLPEHRPCVGLLSGLMGRVSRVCPSVAGLQAGRGGEGSRRPPPCDLARAISSLPEAGMGDQGSGVGCLLYRV